MLLLVLLLVLSHRKLWLLLVGLRLELLSRRIRVSQCVWTHIENWLHIVEHEHIQIFLQLLMRLRLRHHILRRDGDRLARVRNLILIEDVLSLV